MLKESDQYVTVWVTNSEIIVLTLDMSGIVSKSL